MESMRSVGYTLDTSVADIIDNSIAAAASNVWVDSSASGAAHIAITDDGTGMSADEARRSMQLAATSPRTSRAATDLGRFGLGLKTASLAQCRTLTVVSRKGGETVAYRWSLDHLLASQSWALLRLNKSEVRALPGFQRFDDLATGTLVLWEDLDQLGRTIGTEQRDLDQAMRDVGVHLSLVFHRFISGDGGPQITLWLNQTPIDAVDPFLLSNRATQKGPAERLTIHGEKITVQPYTLPFISKLSKKDKDLALVAGTLRDSQGFYIYRARRLVIWGTWFRLVPRNDLGKLARVKVDIPNTLDHLWSLDIKKSVASPPPEVKQELRRLSEKIVQPSQRVQTYRGRKDASQDKVTRVWEVVADREHFRYQINRQHPLVMGLSETLESDSLAALEQVLSLAESAFPVQDVHNRMGQDSTHAPVESPVDDVIEEALLFWDAFQTSGKSIDDFVAKFALIEPFDQIPDFENRARKAIEG
jgi:hypothetical protein